MSVHNKIKKFLDDFWASDLSIEEWVNNESDNPIKTIIRQPTDLDILNFINGMAGNDPARLKLLEKSLRDYHSNELMELGPLVDTGEISIKIGVDPNEKMRRQHCRKILERMIKFVRDCQEPNQKKQADVGNSRIIELAIDIAINGLQNKNKGLAERFMRTYAELKIENPHFNNLADFIREIDWVHHSENTQRDWMERYDHSEKMLLDSK